MKILWLAAYPSPRITREHPVPWLVTLADLLSRHPRVQLSILNWNARQENPVEELDHEGIRFISLRVPAFRQDLFTLYQQRIGITARYLRQHAHRYDLLHLHGSELQFPAAAAGLDMPLLLSMQGLVSECVKCVPGLLSWRKVLWTLAGYYERKYLPLMPNFSCRTHWDAAHAARFNPKARIYHNWEALREPFFRAAHEARAAPAGGRPVLLFMGGSQVMKGYQETLAAFDILRQTTDFKLVIAGGHYPNEVADAYRRYPLRHLRPDDVEYRGYQNGEQLAQLCREAECLIHPSYLDNSPNSVCEAQVAGLPVVATNVGGVSSLIEDGETGLFAELTPDSLAAQVLRLHHDAALRARLARQAQAVALARHDPATVLGRTFEIYQAVRYGLEISPLATASFSHSASLIPHDTLAPTSAG
ncbi:glycosyltransferase family 4 protein [Hymenobacter armeniacus]|uniref:Glycosyltransferase family 4 protein n=1 Tax=Hymenobacter armeniacus TaxID=2771358 RepID=A0ABR8JQD2_9BACT|nr:glycosyltransferase family 4 protein [Hymenobacter armeniacus]MBD2722181.1 glycosyltransferase family 4 protein [Hymenobacter armeniacus]